MNKKLSVLMSALLLVLAGVNCFAQSNEAKARALQGEWVCITLQDGDEIYKLSESPYKEVVEMVWKFEGDTLTSVSKNIQAGTSQTDTATYSVDGDSLVLASGGKRDVYPYTLNGNILIASGDGYVFTLRKR